MNTKTTNIPHMLLPRQIAEQTGISIYRVRRWIAENKICFVRCGRKVLINYDKFIDFLNTGEAEETPI